MTLPLVGSMVTTAPAGALVRWVLPCSLPPRTAASCWASAFSAEICTSMSIVSTRSLPAWGAWSLTSRIGVPFESTSRVLMPGTPRRSSSYSFSTPLFPMLLLGWYGLAIPLELVGSPCLASISSWEMRPT